MNRLLFASGKVIDKPKYHLGKILTLKKEYWTDKDQWGHKRVRELEIIGAEDGQWVVIATERAHPDTSRTPGPLSEGYIDKYYE
jgi:hypothetical protein